MFPASWPDLEAKARLEDPMASHLELSPSYFLGGNHATPKTRCFRLVKYVTRSTLNEISSSVWDTYPPVIEYKKTPLNLLSKYPPQKLTVRTCKKGHPKRGNLKRSYSKHPFSGAMSLSFKEGYHSKKPWNISTGRHRAHLGGMSW